MFGKKKKYLEWYFNTEELNGKGVANEIIDDFITPSSRRSSEWWRSMKPIGKRFQSFKNHIDYISDYHKQIFSGNIAQDQDPHTSTATAKVCPAINDVLTNTYLIKSPADIMVTITKDEGYYYNSSNEHINITSHSTEQFQTEKNNLFNGKMNLKFALPISIRTDKVPWVFLQPMYHNNMWFDVAVGSISDKYTKGQPLNVNVLVDIPKGEPVTYEIKSGDVLAYIWFPEKVELKHSKVKFMESLFKRKWSAKSKFD